MNLSGLAVVALLPVAIGPLPQNVATIRIVICSDYGIRPMEIPIPGKEPEMPEPCPAKACHVSCSRKQFDRSQ